MKKTLSMIGLLSAVSLSACDGSTPANLPSSTPSAQASAQASVSPAATPQASSQSSTSSSVKLPATPSAQPATPSSAPAVTSELEVIGGDVFNQFEITFKEGMRWEYVLRAPKTEISGLPGGISAPSLGSSGDLGVFTQTVTAVNGSQITVKAETQPAGGSFLPPTSTESTFDTSQKANLYSAGFAGEGKGTLTWSAAGSESITVPAGSYTATKINGVMDITTTQNGVTAQLKQDIVLWMSDGVGMVKQNTVSETEANGIQTKVTNVTELQAFSN